MNSPRCVDVPVAAPPPVPSAHPGGRLARFLPVVALVLTAAMVAVFVVTGSALPDNPMFLMFPAMLVISALANLAHGGNRQWSAELDATRRRYLSHLQEVTGELAERAREQRAWLQSLHPDPERLWLVAGTPQQWERRPGHPVAWQVRIGTGPVPAAAKPVLGPAPVDPTADTDPVTADAVDRLLQCYNQVHDAPVTVDLGATGVLRVGGEGDDARATLRALLCQLAVFHSPADVSIRAALGEHVRQQWDWLKWLPHHSCPATVDDAGPVRLTFRTLAAALQAGTGSRRVVVVVDGVPLADDLPAGCPEVTVIGLGGTTTAAHPDSMSVPMAATCARRLAAAGTGVDRPRRDWLGLLGVADPTDVPELWNSGRHRLQIPLGVNDSGDAVHLDINEAALGGSGPHGLCVGATGSGKSELLRTIALGMIARHSPEELNLILIDFKGGATFLDLSRAAHVSAVITNLADEAFLVDRMQEALEGEIHRRQQTLRSAGNLTGITEYRHVRRGRPELPALPTLFIIVDEFSELLSRRPDFIEVFVAIGRLGRSLGIHLLLASQRLDDGRLRGLESHLSYRMCLKTLSVTESRTVLGTGDAHQLPGTPGAGYLKVGADEPVRFQAAYVSGPVAPTPAVHRPAGPVVFSCADVGPRRSAAASAVTTERILDAVLDAVSGHGPEAHRVWLPPVLRSPPLAELLHAGGALRAPIGVCDRAFEQQITPVILELSGASGNIAVVGAPQSGKSTALQTIALALGATQTRGDLALYCLDFGGGALMSLADLPYVGVVAGRQQPDLVYRTVAQLTAVMRQRESLFGRLGVVSMAQYRQRGRADSDPYGEVFLLIDGWSTLRQEFDTLEPAVTALASEGLSFGVHVVLSASRWADLRPALRDQIGTRIELRLGDPVDSELDRHRARLVPRDRPGSGLAPDGHPMTVALPILGGPTVVHPEVPAIRVLPERFDYVHSSGGDVPLPPLPLLGLGGDDLGPVTHDFAEDPLLLISGDSGCGKTAVLRLLGHEIGRTARPAAEVHVLDPRGTLAADLDTLTSYATTVEQCAAVVDVVAGQLADRLRARSAGPDLHLIIDDQDLVGALTPLVDLIPHARDIGLRIVVARRCGSRSLYDPLVTAMRDIRAATLQMNGDDAETPGRAQKLRPGRAVLTTRAGRQPLQVAWVVPQ